MNCNTEIVGDAKDKHCVIVDDLVQTGGTLIECAKVKILLSYVASNFRQMQGVKL